MIFSKYDVGNVVKSLEKECLKVFFIMNGRSSVSVSTWGTLT